MSKGADRATAIAILHVESGGTLSKRHLMHAIGIACLLFFVSAIHGCSLGHRMYKGKSLIDEKRFERSCKNYSDYFNDDGTIKRGRTTPNADNDYSQLHLISNVCTVDGTYDNRMSFAVIEFDDDGTHWDRNQLSAVREEIRLISDAQKERIENGKQITSEGIFLVIFVHGWRHNASEGSSNLTQFRWLAREFANSLEICNKGISDGEETCDSRPHVLAVYLAWPGDSLGLTKESTRGSPAGELLKTLQLATFWGRKSAALRVAGTPATETLLTLFGEIDRADRIRFRTRNDNDQQQSKRTYRSRTLVIGHSFGARVVEHAFAQAFIAKRLDSRRVLGDALLELDKDIDSLDKQLTTLGLRRANLAAQKNDEKGLLNEHNNYIEDKNAQIKRLNAELSRLDRQEDSADLNKYRQERYPEPSAPTAICKEYEPQRVNGCAESPSDIRRWGACAAYEMACVYDSYICAIAERSEELQSSKAWSKITATVNCQDRTMKLEEGLIPEKIATNDTNRWTDFIYELIEGRNAIPNIRRYDRPVDASGSSSQVPDEELLNNAESLLSGVKQWNGMMTSDEKSLGSFLYEQVIRPLYKDDEIHDPTKSLKSKFLEITETASKDIDKIIKSGQQHLDSMRKKQQRVVEVDQIRGRIERLEEQCKGHMDRKAYSKKLIKQYKTEIETIDDTITDITKNIDGAINQVKFDLDAYFRPPADLVLLLNPATEALSAQHLINAMCSTQNIGEQVKNDEQQLKKLIGKSARLGRPWIVSVTSKNDKATKYAFPFGVAVSRFFRLAPDRNNEGDRQTVGDCSKVFGEYRELVTRTAGHHGAIQSHKVVDMKKSELTNKNNKAVIMFSTKEKRFELRAREGGNENEKRYWISQAETGIISDHNDIFNEEVSSLTFALIKHAQIFTPLCLHYDKKNRSCEKEPGANKRTPNVSAK